MNSDNNFPLITDSKVLSEFCENLSGCPFITVDTEFLREKTYYPKLCLVQISGPDGDAVAIDTLADGIDLEPLLNLLRKTDILKVFHSARQDLEIFFNHMGEVPSPIFDTQLAAMVCGYGDSVGYESLVRNILGEKIDKSVQFTDWSRRPISNRMLQYALGDVTYLIDIYLNLSGEIKKRGRSNWLRQEEAVLTSPETYDIDPKSTWRKIKIRSSNRKTLATLRELAAWRETEARKKNLPRNWIMRDETLADMAVHMPDTAEKLAKVRGMSKEKAKGNYGENLLDLIRFARNIPAEDCPERPPRKESFPQELTPVLEMLRMLLRITCAEHEVVPRMVAAPGELEELAKNDDADIPAMKGWRYEVFGEAALSMKRGEISLRLNNGRIEMAEKVNANKAIG